MAGKKNGKTGVKKTSAKKTVKTAAKKSPAKTTAKKTTGKTAARQKKVEISKTPVLVLAIMVLFTVIILLINSNINKPEKRELSYGKNNIKPEKTENVNIPKQSKSKFDNAKTFEKTKREKEKIIEKDIPADPKGKTNQEYYIYLVRFDRKSENMSLAPVKRNVKAESPLADTLKELIKGPSGREKARGLLTAVPPDLRIRDIQIAGRNAVIDFDSSIEENADGQILLTRIDQLVYTITQFSGIDAVIIKVNGRRREFLGGEGLSVSKPLGRRGRH
ncbi:MAG: GerMN domain-containing protein [Spirochaetes bacterium]|nr:GerMN domain-containing protein [Spirochaetota bacterium]